MGLRGAGIALVLASVAGAAGVPAPAAFLTGLAAWGLALVRTARGEVLGWGWILAVALLARAPFLLHDQTSDDLRRCLWEGRIQLAGFSPYEHAPGGPALAHLPGPDLAVGHPELTTIYPPLAQGLFLAAAAGGLAEPGLRNVSLLLDALVVAALLAWLGATRRPCRDGVLYAWCPLVVCSAGMGHVDPLMLLCLVGFGWAWEKGRPGVAAMLLGGAVLAKTVAVLLVPWLALRHPRALVLGFLPVVVLGYLPYLGGDLFGTLFAFGHDDAFNASTYRVLEWLAPGGSRWILLALLTAWTVLVALGQPRVAVAGALLLAGLLVLSPTVHIWYLSWFLVFLPAVGVRRWSLPLLVWALSAAFVGGTYLDHAAGLPFREHFGWTTAQYAIPLGLLLVLAWRWRPRRAPLVSRLTETRPGGEPPAYGVVIPCRGEVESLRRLVPLWLETRVARVVLADTPTGDGTPELVALDPRVEVLAVHEPGYGAAARAGLVALRRCGVDLAVICDADHGLGPGQISSLLEPFRDPDVALVAAARTRASALSAPQRFGNALATFLIVVGWGRWFHDLGPYRALRLGAWPPEALRDPGFGWNVEMNVRALELGLGAVEVPLEAGQREFGENEISRTLSGVARAAWGILSQLYRLREEACARPS